MGLARCKELGALAQVGLLPIPSQLAWKLLLSWAVPSESTAQSEKEAASCIPAALHDGSSSSPAKKRQPRIFRFLHVA